MNNKNNAYVRNRQPVKRGRGAIGGVRAPAFVYLLPAPPKNYVRADIEMSLSLA